MVAADKPSFPLASQPSIELFKSSLLDLAVKLMKVHIIHVDAVDARFLNLISGPETCELVALVTVVHLYTELFNSCIIMISNSISSDSICLYYNNCLHSLTFRSTVAL